MQRVAPPIAPKSFALVAFGVLVVLSGAACDEQSCREKRSTFACDDGYALVCDDLDAPDDPFCVCDGDSALDALGRCRVRDIGACCACLAGVDAGTPCITSAAPSCRDALDDGGTLTVVDVCRTSLCAEPCWFLEARDAGS